MRTFVISISEYAKSLNPNFAIIPQNGIELVTLDGEWNGPLASDYLEAIDAHGQEDLFYGYYEDDQATPIEDCEYLQNFIDVSMNTGNVILVTDYCYTNSKIDQSYIKNENAGYISFAAPERELTDIPTYPTSPHNENADDIENIHQARNFLYLINPSEFESKQAFIDAISQTNYDAIIIDLFFHDNSEFTPSEIEALKTKQNGGSRLVICYMSIGEAENYRYYWQSDWSTNPPDWLGEENPDWEGNFKVHYWDSEWHNIIYGKDNSYLKKILNSGCDGVYLDIIDAFEYFEAQ
jgi:cysteinyl-tRNA synthetase